MPFLVTYMLLLTYQIEEVGGLVCCTETTNGCGSQIFLSQLLPIGNPASLEKIYPDMLDSTIGKMEDSIFDMVDKLKPCIQIWRNVHFFLFLEWTNLCGTMGIHLGECHQYAKKYRQTQLVELKGCWLWKILSTFQAYQLVLKYAAQHPAVNSTLGMNTPRYV